MWIHEIQDGGCERGRATAPFSKPRHFFIQKNYSSFLLKHSKHFITTIFPLFFSSFCSFLSHFSSLPKLDALPPPSGTEGEQ